MRKTRQEIFVQHGQEHLKAEKKYAGDLLIKALVAVLIVVEELEVLCGQQVEDV